MTIKGIVSLHEEIASPSIKQRTCYLLKVPCKTAEIKVLLCFCM